MNDEKETTKEGEHYVCHGGCKGVSTVPGTCQAGDCMAHGKELKKCDCGDGRHNDWKPKE
ncbi:MAG: hypothetical protein UX77_C0009G0026 [Parcubacteria group bacterium GW2011_GWA1_47_11]|nr:MAG: hypothetical protein UX77_C0009G0026 [Parcubacteria group bacterium GW2011_GWA1_47_11]